MKFTKDDLQIFMDIKDLQKSAGFMRILFFMIQQEVEIRTLKAVLTAKKDSHAYECAEIFVSQDPELKEMLSAIEEHMDVLNAAASDPQARLKAMLKAKMEGRL